MNFLDLGMTLAGLALLALGGEFLLRGAVDLAGRSGLSPLLIGLTIVAFATSAPELMVTLIAGFEGSPDVGVGNVVGSNVANILLILGCAAIIRPVQTPKGPVLRDAFAVLVATLILILFAWIGTLGLLQGSIMLVLLVLYIAYSYQHDRKQSKNANDGEAVDPSTLQPMWRSLLILLVGLAFLIVGSELLVRGAVSLARSFGLSEAVIGLTLVAFGTSLPELATAVMAALRRHSEVIIGNVLGSNIFNILLILGSLALIFPFTVGEKLLTFDLWVMLAAILIVFPTMLSGRKISRFEGFVFLILYGLYIGVHFDSGLLPFSL